MKVEVKKVDALRRELKFEIPKDRVSKKLNEVYEEISKVAKIKGFRPGKAPRQMVEQHHSQLAHEEVLKKIIPEVYQEGLQKEKIEPIDMPEIADVNFKDGMITFTAKLDIKPEVNIDSNDYKGIKVQRKSSQVTEDEINKTLEIFKKGQGDKEVVLDDAFARGLGYPSLEEFKKTLTRQMEMDKDQQNRLDLENQIVEAIFKKVKLSVPQSLVNKQIERRIHDHAHRLKHQGVSDEEIKKREEAWRGELKEPVEKDVKVYFIFAKIAALEKFELKEGENLPAKVMEFLLKEAKWEEAK